MEPLTPVYTAPLFAPLHAELIGLLRSRDDGDWTQPTMATAWQVRDVVAHLLDGDRRKLAGGRDGFGGEGRTASSYAAIVDIITEQNASGVSYARRLSPRLMTNLLETTGRWVSEYVAALAPHETSYVAVAWAAEERSENWIDTGR